MSNVLCGSSRDVIKRASGTKISSKSCFVKLDVKDFFLDGSHEEIVKACRKCVERAIASGHIFPGIQEGESLDVEVFVEVLEFLLHNQYVHAGVENVVHRVVRGSGMGMKHSASVSSVCFYELVEHDLCSPEALTEAKISLYVRYHDDILVIGENSKDTKNFYTRVTQFALTCYQITLDDYSLVGVQMLDIFLYKGLHSDGSYSLEHRPFVKPTARHVPLSVSSDHNPSVHKSWPPAEIARMYMLSKHKEDFEFFKMLKISRFVEFSMSKAVLDKCKAWVPRVPSTIARTLSRSSSNSNGNSPLRVVIPYTKHLGDSVKNLAMEIQGTWNILLRGILSKIDLEVSFKNAGPPLHIALRRIGS